MKKKKYKVVLSFRKARFNYDALGFYTLADSAFYTIAKEYTKSGHVAIKIKHLAEYDSWRKCKIIFEGPAASGAAHSFIDILSYKITQIKMR